MLVLGLGYMMNESGQTTTLGLWVAGAGGAVRSALADPRLARGGGDRLGHLVELAVRRTADHRGAPGRAVTHADGRRELLRRRARQDDLAAEPGDRRRRGRAAGPRGRPVPPGASAGAWCSCCSCACWSICRARRCSTGWSSRGLSFGSGRISERGLVPCAGSDPKECPRSCPVDRALLPHQIPVRQQRVSMEAFPRYERKSVPRTLDRHMNALATEHEGRTGKVAGKPPGRSSRGTDRPVAPLLFGEEGSGLSTS